VHPAPDACRVALEQRDHHPEREEVPRGEVGDRYADAHRSLAGIPVIDMSRPCPGRSDRRRALAVGPVWPKPEMLP